MIWLAVFAALSVGILVGFVLGWKRRDVEHAGAVAKAIAEMAPHVPDERDRELLNTYQGLVEKHISS